MEKELRIFTVNPADLAFCWETEVFLSNLRKYNLSQKATVLIGYNKDTEEYLQYWYQLNDKYSECSFNYYDISPIKNLLKVYLPIIRPYCLKLHFQKYPELQEKAIYYTDSDCVFTQPFDFSPYQQDDTIYASDIHSYNDHHYFDSKSKDVMFHKKQDYAKIDALDSCSKIVGISGEEIRKTSIMGGCQYILKNIDWKFWEKVQNDCFKVKLMFNDINSTFFPSEEKGFQGWCTDLHVIWWNLLLRGDNLATPEELDFNWATTPIEEWNNKKIFHNSGLTKDFKEKNKGIFFDKSHSFFRSNMTTPFSDNIIWGEMNQDYCSYKYWRIIQDMKDTAITKVNKIKILK